MPIRIEGFDGLLSKLGEIESRVTRNKILATAMRKAMKPTLEAGKAASPDDFFTPWSSIAEGFRSRVYENSGAGITGRTGVLSRAPQGYWLEWGTSGGISPRRFFGSAWEQTQEEDYSILGDQIMLGILGASIEEELDAVE